MVWVPTLAFLGFGFAHWDHGLTLRAPGAMALVFLAWLALHAGTMWLNAALDRDEGHVLLGRPLPVPDGIVPLAYGALAVSIALASLAGGLAGACAAACAGLAVAYSHPALAWKGHPVLGPLVNAFGYGVLSPLAGWSVVGAEPTPRAALTLVVTTGAALGAYFAAQAFQEREDRARGYRTLVATHGTGAALTASRLAFGAAFGTALLLAAAGAYPRACLVALPAVVALDGSLAAAERAPERVAGSLVRAVTLVLGLLVGGAYAEYARELLAGEELVAGLATARR